MNDVSRELDACSKKLNKLKSELNEICHFVDEGVELKKGDFQMILSLCLKVKKSSKNFGLH